MKKIFPLIIFVFMILSPAFPSFELAASPNDSNVYTIVWLSDTQYYSEKYPHIFRNQMDWIVQNRDNWNIQYVVHTGDIINRAEKKQQWVQADRMFRKLEQVSIPYGVLAGNHDLVKGKSYKMFHQYFGKDRFFTKPYYGGGYRNNRGHYDLITLGHQHFLFLYIGWHVDKDSISWMNEVLKRHSDRTAIIAVHKYLHKNGKRTLVGNRIFRNIVKKNPNVKIVLSGHYDDSELLKTKIDDDHDGTPDRIVYELLADYQGAPEGGEGFLRLLHYFPSRSKFYVRAYSPYSNKHFFFPPKKEEFWIE